MLSVDGDADAVVKARIRIGWNKFRQLVTLLTNRDISLTSGARARSARGAPLDVNNVDLSQR